MIGYYGFLYRTASFQLTIAGLQPIDLQDRRMFNVDLTNIVSLFGYAFLSEMFC